MIYIQNILRNTLIFASLFLGFWTQSSLMANAAEKELVCNEDLSRISCELRSSEPFTVDKVSVKSNNKEVNDVTFLKFSDLKSPAVLTFLLDLNTKQDPVLFARQKKLISTVVTSNIQNVKFEVVGFSNSASILAPAGTAPGTIKLALGGLLQNGKTTEILKAASQFIDQMKDREGSRKVAVILSDGSSDDKAYSAQEVSAKLKAAQYTVYSVIPSHAKSDIQAAQILQRISDETHGKLLSNGDDRDTDNSALSISALMSNGGMLFFDKVGQDFTINVNFSGAAPEVFHYKSPTDKNLVDLSVGKGSPQDPTNKAEDATAIGKYEQAFLDWFNLNDTNRIIGYGSGVLLLLILFVIVARFTKANNKRTTVPSVEPALPPDNNFVRPILAWFEVLDGKNSQETINSASTTIGRQKDNDIVFLNTSVHRHHAVLTQDPNGHFVITDLGGENGTLVNSVRKDNSILNDGDIVELGEVRMRFRIPTGK
jgi:FHA domain/von Willebrand factor type A domain